MKTAKFFFIAFASLIFFSLFLFSNINCQKEIKSNANGVNIADNSKDKIVSKKSSIVYTDVNPDKILSCSTNGCEEKFHLDLDNDGTPDFRFYTHSDVQGECNKLFLSAAIYQLRSNEIADSIDYNSVELQANAEISSKNNYDTLNKSTSNLRAFIWSSRCTPEEPGFWISGGNGYLGLKIVKNGKKYYGWVRLALTISATGVNLTIKDYAYNSNPGHKILAGEQE